MKLFAESDPDKLHPALVFKRVYPACTWRVPPVPIPLYWFDDMMVRKKLIVGITPQVFIVDGRRFQVLAKDTKWIGGRRLIRWLVYEETAAPEGV